MALKGGHRGLGPKEALNGVIAKGLIGAQRPEEFLRAFRSGLYPCLGWIEHPREIRLFEVASGWM